MTQGIEGRLLGGAYRVGRLLGRGAMGAVYEATHERLGRPVAIKLLLRQGAALSPDDVRRFEREARAAAALGHPNIVQVTDFQWLSGEPPMLVMERLPGESLGQKLGREGAIPVELGCLLMTQVLDALATAHRAGIVHRDVKPDNVCLVPMGPGLFLAKVVDFGVAKLTGEAPITVRGTMVGTPAYMAPEQALAGTIDGRTDVYAAGATLYHVLSGRLPIDENAPFEQALEQIVRVPPPPLTSVVRGIDPRLSAVVERAMAKDPSHRFQTADALREALLVFVQRAPSSAALLPMSHLAQSVTPGTPALGPSPSPFGPTVAAAPPTHPSPPALPPFGPPHAAASVGPVYGAPATSPAPTYGPPPTAAPPYGPPPTAQAPAQGQTGFPAAQTPHAPARGSVGLVVLGLGLGLLAVAVIGVGVGYAVWHGEDPPPTSATKPSKDAGLATSASSAEPDDEPAVTPSGSGSTKAPSAPSGKRKDAGALDASVSPTPPSSPSSPASFDASVPTSPRVTRVMSRTSADMGPYGMAGSDAMAAFDAAVPAFRACAPLACLRIDKIVRDEPWLSVDVRYEVTTSGSLRHVGFSPGLPLGPSCPPYEACLAARTSSLKMPKPERNGVFSVGLTVVERPVK
ncbi:MAG: protein kinase [Polyangiaceae bacterium]